MTKMGENKKGVVLEAVPGQLTVLTPQGEFLNVPWSQAHLPLVGSEVQFKLPVVKKRFFSPYFYRALAACLLILFVVVPLWSGMILPGPSQVVAYVNVDINPSIEMGIDGGGTVREVEALNEDAQRLIEKLDIHNLEVNKAVQIIVKEAAERKYLSEEKDNLVLITVSSDVDLNTNLQDLAAEAGQVLKERGLVGQANIIETTLVVHEEAKKYQLSTGKYVVFTKALDEGLNVSLEDIKTSNIVKAIKEAGGVPGQVISRVIKERQDERKLTIEQQRKNQEKQGKYDETKGNNQKDSEEKDNKKPKDNGLAIDTDSSQNPGNKGNEKGSGNDKPRRDRSKEEKGKEGESGENGNAEVDNDKENDKREDKENDKGKDKEKEKVPDKGNREKDENNDESQENSNTKNKEYQGGDGLTPSLEGEGVNQSETSQGNSNSGNQGQNNSGSSSSEAKNGNYGSVKPPSPGKGR